MHAAGAWERVPGYPGERESLTAAGYMCIPACARRLSGVHKYIYLLTEHSSTSHRIACIIYLILAFFFSSLLLHTGTYTRAHVCACVHPSTSSHLGGTPSSRPSAYTAHRTAPPCKVRTGCARVYRILQGGVCTPSTHGTAPYRCCKPYLLCPLRHCLHRQFATLSHHQRNQSAPQKLIHRLSQYTVYSE